MDIILKPFNNPNLPIITLPGFFDDFNRDSADVLGSTVDGKDWKVFDPGTTSSVWGTYGDGTGGMKSSTSRHHIACVDALTPDGTLSATLADVSGVSSDRYGLALRVVDAGNYISIARGSGSLSELTVISVSTGGNVTILGSRLPALAEGDTIRATVQGNRISVQINDGETYSETLPTDMSGTSHGFFSFQGATAKWDMIEFTPA